MFFIIMIVIGGIIIAAVVALNPSVRSGSALPASKTTLNMHELTITSSAFDKGGLIPQVFTCDGDDVSPPLQIEGVPSDAESLVLIMDDPDAPVGTWDHWIVFNMPPGTREVPEGAQPEGVGGKNSWGRVDYGGPCPPDKEHRYVFKVFALDLLLELGQGVSKQDVLDAMKGHVLGYGELVGRYDRQR